MYRLATCFWVSDLHTPHRVCRLRRIFYNLSEQNAIVTRNYSKDYEGDVVIPSSVTYNGVSYSVSGIDEYCFYECEGLTSVVS